MACEIYWFPVHELIDPNADFQILEDIHSVPGHVRVLIGRRRTTGKLVNLAGLKHA